MVAEAHGGRLRRAVLAAEEAARLEREVAEGLVPVLDVPASVAYDVAHLGTGLYSPLTGPLDEAGLAAVLATGRLPDGLPWTVPILLPVAERLAASDRVAIAHGGRLLARLDGARSYTFPHAELARGLYGTLDPAHPGVRRLLAQPDTYLTGTVAVVARPWSDPLDLDPSETRAALAARGWRKVAAFQTRNAPHIGHEYVQKTALSLVDGLLLNPVLGPKKAGDFADAAIVAAYEALIRHYYPPGTVLLGTVRYAMRYAGPREAVHHAIMRKNLGCTHFIVGRDHAGVGDFYPPYAAQAIFADYPDLGIEPLCFGEFYHCRRCGTITNERVCPHPPTDREPFSGTAVRRFLTGGGGDAAAHLRPEVLAALGSVAEPFVAPEAGNEPGTA
jgi:sulfate adenylyltransferase